MYVKLHELKRCPFCGELAEVYRIPEADGERRTEDA